MKLTLILTTAIVGTAAALLGTAAPAQAAPFVYVTNIDTRSVSQYDAAGGTLTPLSPALVSTGNNPLGVAVSPNGKDAYVSITENYDTPEIEAAVSHYSVGADGALTLKSSAPVPPDTNPSDLALSPDGRNLYVASGGPVIQYTVGAAGELALKSPPMVPAGGTELAVSPDGRNLYVAGGVTGLSTVSQYTVGADGTLSPKSPPSVLVDDDPFVELSDVAASPDGQSVYVVNFEALVDLPGAVLQYTVGADGTLSPKSPPTVLAGTNPFRLAVSPDGRSVYVTHSQESASTGESTGTVLQYAVGAEGTLRPMSPSSVAAGPFPSGIAVSGDAKIVYVANEGDDTVSQYSVGADGTLSPKLPAIVTAGMGPYAIAISPPAPAPTTKARCTDGGWRSFPQFKNQGQCVAFVERGPGPKQASGTG